MACDTGPSSTLRDLLNATLIALTAVGIAGCGDDPPEWPERAVNEPAPASLEKGATLAGAVTFTGKAPRAVKLSMGNDYCRSSHKNPVFREDVVLSEVDGQSRLRDVFIHVTKGLENWTFDWDKEPQVIDQRGCLYVPHVVGVRTWQPVTFRNSDATPHNVNTTSSSQGFNKSTPNAGSSFTRQFKRPEMGIRAKCDVHPWMNALIHVVDHPYFAVSAADGTWQFSRPLPPGTYTLEARHPLLETRSREVVIEEDKPTPTVDFPPFTL